MNFGTYKAIWDNTMLIMSWSFMLAIASLSQTATNLVSAR